MKLEATRDPYQPNARLPGGGMRQAGVHNGKTEIQNHSPSTPDRRAGVMRRPDDQPGRATDHSHRSAAGQPRTYGLDRQFDLYWVLI
jgi:hypothetical protein